MSVQGNPALEARVKTLNVRLKGKGYRRLLNTELDCRGRRTTVREWLMRNLMPGRYVLVSPGTDVTLEAVPDQSLQKRGGFIGDTEEPLAAVWWLPV
jgi:hypothetical protein